MRKSETVTVPAEGFGRDAGKQFLITEKPAVDAERWAWRMFIAMKGTSGNIPLEADRLGMVGVAILGLNTFLAAPVKFDELRPLLDELLECVKIIRDPRYPGVATPLTGLGDEIEEVPTVAWLRSEVLRVHTGFSFADGLLNLITMVRTSADSQTT